MAHPKPLQTTRRHWLAATSLAWLGGHVGTGQAQLPAGDDPEASAIWQKLRRQLFEDRPIQVATEAQLSLTAPRRAEDPAFVPLSVHSGLPRTPTEHVKRLTLLIDNNPSPIPAIIDLPLNGALPELETRVRVDEYSFVRAVAEMNDGRLFMATRFVKASGGCSAPAGADEAAARAALGRMLFRAEGPLPSTAGQPLTVQWMVSHPNHSGLAMNQLSRQFTPAEYVRSVHIWQGERLLLSADVDFALSENPSLRFRFVPQGDAPLRAEVLDTRDRRFSASSALASLAP